MDMAVEQGTALTGLLAMVGALVWLLRLEGRVNTGETRFNDLKTDVQYIRERIDAALKK